MAFGTNGGFKTGQLIEFAGNAAPDGFLPCNGAAVSRTTYAALFNVIGTIWGAGDGSTTFNIPNFINKFVKGSSTSGTVNAESLPNHTHNVSGIPTGSLNGGQDVFPASNDDVVFKTVTTSGVNSSTVYKDGAKVQPDNATVIICIKY